MQDDNGDLLEQYWYGVKGTRVKKTSGTTTTYSFFGHYEEEVTGAITTTFIHYRFGGLRFAVKRGGDLYHLHGDHLGGTSLTTDAAGADTASRTYYAYGAERSSSGTLQTDRTFTGQESDVSGLLYCNARYYDPALGTSISPDSIVLDAEAVIDYNRFMYARNSPLRYTDPTGHCIFEIATLACVVRAAALVGGLTNAAANAAWQVGGNWDRDRTIWKNVSDINAKEIGIAIAAGATAGALVPFVGGAATIAEGAVIGAGQQIATDMAVHGETFVEAFDESTARAAVIGGTRALSVKVIPT